LMRYLRYKLTSNHPTHVLALLAGLYHQDKIPVKVFVFAVATRLNVITFHTSVC
jgi:uncharacterized protein YigE (DUF2233 family)